MFTREPLWARARLAAATVGAALLVALTLLLVLPTPPKEAQAAGTLTHAPTRDARVEEASASTNYGGSAALRTDAVFIPVSSLPAQLRARSHDGKQGGRPGDRL